MALKEYKPAHTFPGRIWRTVDESEPAWPMPLRAQEGTPNVLFIVLDDTGFGQLGCPIHNAYQRLREKDLLLKW